MTDNSKDIIKITFLRTEWSDTPGWEFDKFVSPALAGEWFSERACLVDTCIAFNLLGCTEMAHIDLVDTTTLEKLLLDNNFYVAFEEA